MKKSELENWRKLHQLMMGIKKLAPWEKMDSDDLIELRLKDSDSTVLISVMGNLGECYGIAVYSTPIGQISLLDKLDTGGFSEIFVIDLLSYAPAKEVDLLISCYEALFESFQSQEQLQRKLHFVDQMIQEISEGTSEGWWKDYQLKKWLPYKMQVLVDLDESNERLRFFFEQHQQIVEVRSRYIDELISRKEYHEAVKCLEDSVKSKEIPDETRWKYQWLLKDLYRKMDNRQAYQKMLWTLAQQMSKFDFHLELYNELKSQYTSEEWLNQREQLIQSWEKSHGDLNRIYKLEGLYDRLMKNLLENGTIYDLAAYEDILKKDYSPQLLERYQTLVEEMAVPVTNRRTYQQIASLLRRMKKFKGGTLKVHGLVLDLQEKYKRRRAMVEELGKVLS